MYNPEFDISHSRWYRAARESNQSVAWGVRAKMPYTWGKIILFAVTIIAVLLLTYLFLYR